MLKIITCQKERAKKGVILCIKDQRWLKILLKIKKFKSSCKIDALEIRCTYLRVIYFLFKYVCEIIYSVIFKCVVEYLCSVLHHKTWVP